MPETNPEKTRSKPTHRALKWLTNHLLRHEVTELPGEVIVANEFISSYETLQEIRSTKPKSNRSVLFRVSPQTIEPSDLAAVGLICDYFGREQFEIDHLKALTASSDLRKKPALFAVTPANARWMTEHLARSTGGIMVIPNPDNSSQGNPQDSYAVLLKAKEPQSALAFVGVNPSQNYQGPVDVYYFEISK